MVEPNVCRYCMRWEVLECVLREDDLRHDLKRVEIYVMVDSVSSEG